MDTSHSEVCEIELDSTTANKSDTSYSEVSDIELHSTPLAPLIILGILRTAKYPK